MNRQTLTNTIRCRAAALDQLNVSTIDLIRKYAYALNTNALGLTNPDAVEESAPSSAVFTITDNSVDRDGDQINIAGVHLSNWAKVGAPVMFSHGDGHPAPIGSCLGDDGQLD